MTRTRTAATPVEASTDSSELAKTVAEINKEYPHAITRASATKQPERISTGIFLLDMALMGGIARSRVTGFLGEKHSGKSTTSFKCLAAAQRAFPDEVPVLVDLEGTYDATWAARQGVDNDRLYKAECETGEMAIDVTEALVRSRETSLIVVDSLAALVPSKEVEGSASDHHVGLQARLVNKFVRKMISAMIAERKRGHYPALLFINQYRLNVGQMFGDPRTPIGGRAIDHLLTMNVEFTNKEKEGKDAEGNDTISHNEHAFRVKKNKCNGGLRYGEFQMVREPTEDGLQPGDIDDGKTMLVYARSFGLFTGAGANQKLSIGKTEQTFRKVDDAVRWLYQNPEQKRALRRQLLAAYAQSKGMDSGHVKYLLNHG